jgi:adenine-specific DNA-methyltransferase
MIKKQKLELTWIGKENRPRLEPRILLEDPLKSYHAKHRTTDNDLFDNRLIFGDNLLALKALEQEFTGKIKCIFIDPPYNTGSAFEHYDDGIEHSLWLSLMRDRLELLRRLLSQDGSLWITLDDNEQAYCRVLCDEIFGRANFIANLAWHKRISPANDAKYFSADHDHIIVFAKEKANWKPNRLPRSAEQLEYYKNPDNDPRGAWNSAAYTCAKSVDERPNLYYAITNPNSGEKIWPSRTRVWAYDEARHRENERLGLLYWGKDGRGRMPRIKKFLEGGRDVVPRSIWSHAEAGHNQEAKLETMALFPDKPFGTPKPERLLQKVLLTSTQPNDLVLDSFGGSGTTGAVAHKMGRRWIMVELEETCHTHIIPRLKKVIDGADPGGVTEAVSWKGGGGFRYYRLAPSLLEKDKWGNWVISNEFNAAMLAEAVCKLEGFRYGPSDTVYWQHGYSTERDFIYVTTQHLRADQIAQLSDEVGPDRTLLVLCAAFRPGTKSVTERYPNLTVKKIPKQVLSRCEWGHDDYSLKVEDLPKAPPPPPKVDKKGQQSLFGEEVSK